MYLLWCMITGHQPDIGHSIMQQFDKVVKLHTGLISIGGLITSIARHFEIEVAEMEPVPGSNLLSQTDLATMRMFLPAGLEGSWVIQTRGGFFRLSNTHLTDVRSLEDQSNWSMYTTAHQTTSRDPTQEEHRLYQAPFLQGQGREGPHMGPHEGDEVEIGEPSTQAPMHEGQQPAISFDDFRGHVNERLTAYEELIGTFSDKFQLYDQRFDSMMQTQQSVMEMQRSMMQQQQLIVDRQQMHEQYFETFMQRQQSMIDRQEQMYLEHQAQMARLARDYPPPPQ